MAESNNSEFKQHISIEERNKWDKVVVDFAAHLGSGGDKNHVRANGTVPGFSMCDFTPEEKAKLAGIEDGALNNPHPSSHSYTEITGLSVVGHSGEFRDLLNIPNTCYVAESGNCNYINGVYIHVGPTAPSNITPQNNKCIWFDTSTKLIKIFMNDNWEATCAVF